MDLDSLKMKMVKKIFYPDTKLAIYENWFDPEKPRENLIAFNDDIDFSGENKLSRVPNLQLEQGKQYIIIVIPFMEDDTGSVYILVNGLGTISHQETPFTFTVQYDGNGWFWGASYANSDY